MESIQNQITELQDIKNTFEEDYKNLINELYQDIEIDRNRDISGEWSKEYTAGYIESAKKIIGRFEELLKF